MPVFHPEHADSAPDDFTRGYLACAEWLLPEETNRDTIRGWHRSALVTAHKVCAQFQRDNAELLAQYEESTGRDMESAGHDFYLSSNGHGTGFWDRGTHPCLDALHSAACKSGGLSALEAYVGRGLIRWYAHCPSSKRRPDSWLVIHAQHPGNPWRVRTKRDALKLRRELLQTFAGPYSIKPAYDGVKW